MNNDTSLNGWGRYPVLKTELKRPRDLPSLTELVGNGPVIARGNGRSYGDSAIGLRRTLDMRSFNRMLSFSDETGQLVCEAGVLLSDVINVFLPRGWFPLVTPGTRKVTIGGMIAADVHGKNHHRVGSFGSCLDWIELMDQSGQITRCSRDQNQTIFEWTIGGMGLTGIIVRAAFRLRNVDTAWINQTLVAAAGVEQAIDLFEDNMDAEYSVAWIDCLAKGKSLGRSLVMLGEHAGIDELSEKQKESPLEIPKRRALKVPIDFPGFALNQVTIKAFNQLYYLNGLMNAGSRLIDWESYFYPLDAISDWNRVYGKRGFMQFQCVLPLNRSRDGIRALVKRIAEAGTGSFLAVLKRFGKQQSRFSFPMEGYTLALDFPVKPQTLALMTILDDLTLEYGGRFYLAKDSRMPREIMVKSDERFAAFSAMRKEYGLSDHFVSSQSKRLGL